MKVIGLCGGSGSGKGCVCEIFKAFDIPSIDTDMVYRQLTSSESDCLLSLKKEFGEGIVNGSGALDRAALRKIVFEGDGCGLRRETLNKIAHKYILARTDELLSEYDKLGKKAAIVDAPLLFESGYDKRCDVILAVIADEHVRINRIIKRDGISPEAAKLRVRTQLSDEELKKLCDYYIVNNGDFTQLESQVREIAYQIINS